MPVLETLPDNLRASLEEEPVLCVRSDIGADGRIGARWLVATHSELLVLTEDPREERRFHFSSVIEARNEPFVGGGRLVLDTAEGRFALLEYTAARARHFAVAAEAINALAKGEPLPVVTERDLPRTCPTCGRPLQEGTNVCPVCVDKGRVIVRLLRYARPYRVQMVWSAVLLVFATVVELIPPYLTKAIVDKVLQPRNLGSALLWLVLALLATNVLRMVLQTVRGYVGVWCGSRIMGDIRRDTYRALMRLSLRYFDRRQTSQFIGRVNSDAQAMQAFLTDGVVLVTGQVMMTAAIVIVMLRMNVLLALLAFAMTPLIVLASLVIWPYIRNRWYRQWRAMTRLNMIVGDSLQGIRVVKAFGQEAKERSRYEAVNEDLVIQTTKMDGMWQGVFPVFNFLSGFGVLLVWYCGGWQVLHGQVTLGTLMAFNAYLGMLLGPLQWFSQLINWMSNAMAAADRVFEIMDTEPDVAEAPDAVPVPRMQGRVEFRKVTFGYDKHRPVLRDIDLVVEPGEMIGLVGHSGAGKSTIINLVCRFYDPDVGEITIDGIDLRRIRQEDLHRHIGIVLQETFLFDGTVAENIAYSKPDATPEEIIRAAKIANAHGFIMKMEDGYDTRVGERGHRLSGGEKQRIAIARAVLHNPSILILDEATASLDTETERQIQEAIARLVKGRTTIAIAHRLSTLRNANRLVVLEHGKIVELGTHDELLRKRGVYYRLVQAQREMSRIRGVEG